MVQATEEWNTAAPPVPRDYHHYHFDAYALDMVLALRHQLPGGDIGNGGAYSGERFADRIVLTIIVQVRQGGRIPPFSV